jgi:hypothetical protein
MTVAAFHPRMLVRVSVMASVLLAARIASQKTNWRSKAKNDVTPPLNFHKAWGNYPLTWRGPLARGKLPRSRDCESDDVFEAFLPHDSPGQLKNSESFLLGSARTILL